MALHHIVTIILYAGFYMSNLWEIGVLISFMHDSSDITANLVKVTVETKSIVLLVPNFAVHMFMWFWERLVVLPMIIYFCIT